ncbi:hypothetical protein D9C73_025219 [Collichthys lucidus]|uniref:Uncharacterized protein n=1 Tax=Collichthys lucidus TaxID=240159 RepID=A0A4U5VUN2_COLLU|nr:hypothetical protein D9C73_025219 [Collichthys lucidus]
MDILKWCQHESLDSDFRTCQDNRVARKGRSAKDEDKTLKSGLSGYYYQGVWRTLDGTAVQQFTTSSAIIQWLSQQLRRRTLPPVAVNQKASSSGTMCSFPPVDVTVGFVYGSREFPNKKKKKKKMDEEEEEKGRRGATSRRVTETRC